MQVKIYEKEKEKKGDKKVSQAQGRAGCMHAPHVPMTVGAGALQAWATAAALCVCAHRACAWCAALLPTLSVSRAQLMLARAGRQQQQAAGVQAGDL